MGAADIGRMAEPMGNAEPMGMAEPTGAADPAAIIGTAEPPRYPGPISGCVCVMPAGAMHVRHAQKAYVCKL